MAATAGAPAGGNSVAERLARLKRHREAGGGDIGPEESVSLAELLQHFKLLKFESALEEMGLETFEDFAYLREEDLEKLGVPLIPRRKLLEACGCQWQAAPTSKQEAAPLKEASSAKPTNAPIAKGNAEDGACRKEGGKRPSEGDRTPPRLVPSAVEPAEDDGGDASSGEEEQQEEDQDAELAELLARLEHFVADFAAANGLDEDSKATLLEIPPVAALRAMGLIGRGNAFVMKGVRKPGPAVLSRTRAAAAEVSRSGGSPNSLPFEEWPRLLDSFCEANGLCDDTCRQLRALRRRQALRVMGFTSSLAFVVPAAAGDDAAEEEVAARLRATLNGAPMPPAAPRRGRGPQPARLSAALQARSPVPAAPRRERARSRSREGDSRHGSRRSSEVAPYWQKNIETFVEVNDLDDRSVQVLNELPKHHALRVMGLVGRENSFIIRGARNPSAAMMHRLQRVQEGHGGDEPYAQLHKLVEDFISVNDFDDRGLEVVRTLRPEVALHVMGFTADNTFAIRGVSNPSAALMARVAVAQRIL